jgi:hypothetical protein
MSLLTRFLCTVAALGLTWATMAGAFIVLGVISDRLDRLSCLQEASLSRLSADHCASR